MRTSKNRTSRLPQALRLAASLLSPFSFSLTALAEVNVKDASFVKGWTDLPQFERHYNSRSLHQGLFGFGWCTEFEKTLDFSIPNKIILKDCGLNQDLPFASANEKSILYRADNHETILLSKGLYIRTLQDKSVQIYDTNGRLRSLRGPQSIDLTYDDTGQLRKIDFARKYVLRLQYQQNPRRIKTIEGPRQLLSSYFYYKDKDSNLAEVHNAWKSKYHFTYDELQNLTQVDYPDKTSEKITYDKNKDWVLSYQDRNKCAEEYIYTQETSERTTSQIIRKCQQQAPIKVKIEFWHKTKLARTYLEHVRITRGEKVQDIHYDPISGAAIRTTSQAPRKLARLATLSH